MHVLIILLFYIYYYSVKGDDSNDIISSKLDEMRQEQEKLIKEKQIITG